MIRRGWKYYRKTKTGLWSDQAQANTAASPSSIIESELVFMVLGNGCEYIIIIISNARARCIISLHTTFFGRENGIILLYYYYIIQPLCYVV